MNSMLLFLFVFVNQPQWQIMIGFLLQTGLLFIDIKNYQFCPRLQQNYQILLEMQTYLIESEMVLIYCFIGSKFNVKESICSFQPSNLQKTIRINFYLLDLPLFDQADFVDKMRKDEDCQFFFESYQITIRPNQSKQHALQNIKNLGKTIKDQHFDLFYSEIVEKVTKETQEQLIRKFLSEDLQWGPKRIDKFIQKEGYNKLEKLINYSEFLPKEAYNMHDIKNYMEILKELQPTDSFKNQDAI